MNQRKVKPECNPNYGNPESNIFLPQNVMTSLSNERCVIFHIVLVYCRPWEFKVQTTKLINMDPSENTFFSNVLS